ncbi:GDSL-type esterase/lipase family protein [Nodularia sphaerocarpa]|uniref:GDSL-type esterase/lipase family protein n=1 Tax=Nodularia sphaerocarpa TaxID=137816 RepID=UPI001EFB394E|nr:GDSL-type esterase/lipase family protein [Nodularia sphaerocarpa]MDB9373886.1 GDSL-type esterase/lipase family protein [Nodularia sphaerocarpa CS-585]MDB9378833.1 GDSL-type esterase/lipase family protein [Nodularia sphaerocarpa CS-585A2]
MRYPYLLAVGLLTGLAIPASALPQMSIIQPETNKLPWDVKPRSQITVDEKNITNLEISLAQFSHQPLPKSLLHLSSRGSHLPLISGYQLYYQRWASLKAGQIYTRIVSNSSQSFPSSANKRQVTYEEWKNLLALEAKAISQGQGESYLGILVGDSLSMWFPREKLPTGKLWLNQGISGDTSGGIFRRLRAFSATRPNVIYIMAGINDLRNGDSNAEILRNHRRIIRSLRQSHPNTQIIVQSILPTRLESIPNSRIVQINTELALIAQEEKVDYLNIYPWFTDFEGNLRSDLTTDGLHLSQDGYDVWRWALHR